MLQPFWRTPRQALKTKLKPTSGSKSLLRSVGCTWTQARVWKSTLVCLHWCQLLSGFSDSQSWAQQSEIKKQNQKKLGRRQSERRVLREAAETRGLGGSSVEAPADWGAGYSAPEPEDPESHPHSRPSGPGVRKQHSAARWRPDALTPTPP